MGNVYHVYQAPILEDTKYTYLFDTTNIDQIVYQDDFIYYLYDKEIRYYSPLTGVKTVLSNTEFTYNKSLKFGVFISWEANSSFFHIVLWGGRNVWNLSSSESRYIR